MDTEILPKHHDGPTEYETYYDDEYPFAHTRVKHRHYMYWTGEDGRRYGEWRWEAGSGTDGREGGEIDAQ